MAGDTGVRTLTKSRKRLRSGDPRGKLMREAKEWIYRWQRMYPYGYGNVASTFPTNTVLSAFDPPDPNIDTNLVNQGRLFIGQHSEDVSTEEGIKVTAPLYLWDLTTWRTQSQAPNVCKRLGFDFLSRPKWFDVLTQSRNGDDVALTENKWQHEKAPASSATPFPTNVHQKALLSWGDMRFVFYGARDRATTFRVSLVQFTDPQLLMDYHPDGEALDSTTYTAVDYARVQKFWIDYCKRMAFNPIDCQQSDHPPGFTVLHTETFKVNPQTKEQLDNPAGRFEPPAHVHRLFRRFERLVRWDWAGNATQLDVGGGDMQDGDWQTEDKDALLSYADPRARVFLMLQAEQYGQQLSGDTQLFVPAVAATPDVTAELPYLNAVGAAGALPAQPANTVVCGYHNDVETLQTNGSTTVTNYYRVPTLCPEVTPGTPAVPEFIACDHVPSFDVLIRTCWRVLD